MLTFSLTEAEDVRKEINWVSVAASLFRNPLENGLCRPIITKVSPHLDMPQTEKLQFAKRFPMQSLKEPGVLILHRGQKFPATERVRGRYRLVNQACS